MSVELAHSVLACVAADDGGHEDSPNSVACSSGYQDDDANAGGIGRISRSDAQARSDYGYNGIAKDGDDFERDHRPVLCPEETGFSYIMGLTGTARYACYGRLSQRFRFRSTA